MSVKIEFARTAFNFRIQFSRQLRDDKSVASAQYTLPTIPMTSWFGARLSPDPPPGSVTLSRSQQRRHDGSPTNFPSVGHVCLLLPRTKSCCVLTLRRQQLQGQSEDLQETLSCILSILSKQDSKQPLTFSNMAPWDERTGRYLVKRASEACTGEPCQCS